MKQIAFLSECCRFCGRSFEGEHADDLYRAHVLACTCALDVEYDTLPPKDDRHEATSDELTILSEYEDTTGGHI